MKTIRGNYYAKGKRFVIIYSRFNELIVNELVNGATDCLTRHGVSDDSITTIQVPGAWEIPLTVAKLIQSSNQTDAILCLGAIIRGDTPHFEYVASEVAKGIATLGTQADIPIVYGILTADDLDQAMERAGTKQGNRGWDAALTAIEMVDVFEQLRNKSL
ncbi:MAG: 6,7-dimethyl-8-ribityllumazine synthase [bacterium]|nr:6,7-dimethyl-8-ribityllumazine synthase [bacterium]